jgi:hypothetical protein
MMTRTIGKMTMLALAFAGWTSFSGCSGRQANTGGIVNQDTTGSMTFALQVAPGITVNTVNYMITGPNAFMKSGTIDVSASTQLTATIGGMPGGTGYQIMLTATATDGTTGCGGSASFNIMSRQTTSVVVALTCHETPKTGSVTVNGTLNVCPVADGLNATPGEVLVGGSIALSATAHDTDNGPSPLTYAWQTTSGTLSNPSAPNPSLLCTTPGKATVTVTVSDGDPLASCADSLSADVNCTGNVTGVVTSAVVVPGRPTRPSRGATTRGPRSAPTATTTAAATRASLRPSPTRTGTSR